LRPRIPDFPGNDGARARRRGPAASRRAGGSIVYRAAPPLYDRAWHTPRIRRLFPTFDPDQYLFNTFHSSATPAQWDAWSDTEVDALLEQGRAETDTAKRQAIYTDVQKMLCEKVAAIWTYNPEYVEVATKRLKNYQPHPT